MKKLFLLLAVGVACSSANAQQNSSNIFTQQRAERPGLPKYKSKHTPGGTFHSANKTTSVPNTYWFSFQEENYSSTIAATTIYPIYNDSTLYVPGGSPNPFYWYLTGLGTSFDPVSSDFLPGNIVNPAVPLPTFTISNSNPYTIDSIEIVGFYDRKPYNNYVDTLNIYIAAAGMSLTGTTLLNSKDVYYLDNLGITDSTLHFADVVYDSITNSIISSQVPGVIKIQKILDAAAFADSDANGYHDWYLRLPSVLSVPAGAKVVAYQQYISGNVYPFGHDIDSTNIWDVLTYELLGMDSYPHQNVKDYNAGLITTTESRLNLNSQGTILGGKHYINTTYDYPDNAEYDDPYFAFKVSCPTCTRVAVQQINTFSGIKAYPNPTSGELNITYSLSNPSDITISVTDMMGQVVASQKIANTISGKTVFSTTQLPAGMYMYTVQSGGIHNTGRVIISH